MGCSIYFIGTLLDMLPPGLSFWLTESCHLQEAALLPALAMPQHDLQLIDAWCAFSLANLTVSFWFAIRLDAKYNQSSLMPWFTWELACFIPSISAIPILFLVFAREFWLPYSLQIHLALRGTCIVVITFIEVSVGGP